MFSATQILKPVSGDRPGGDDLAFSPELDAIAHARKFDDPSLDQGEWVTELKEADWGFVVERCALLLETRSKDLRLAVWLAEAAAYQYHLRGLAEGWRVLAGLCEQYWDDGLFPEADGDHELRIGNLAWILGRTPALLRAIPLTEGRGSAYSMADFEAARKLAASGTAPADGPKLAEMEAAKRNSSPAFREALAADAAACMDALAAFEQAADARLGADSPSFTPAREALQALIHVLPPSAAQAVAGADGTGLPADGMPAGALPGFNGLAGFAGAAGAGALAVGSIGGWDQPVAAPPPGVIANRTQAVALLRTVAQFFRKTEPHSPVSYFADKAADAADQDLHTWLRSVIKDPASMEHIEELLGVKGRPEN
ncbi:type VI secretion system protein TssA [Pseudoduganella ginsengisoli]|uniref:Type VI secretion system protein TssA n=1 Tax=Pseudoduganella ginsengisoli TaxID=1462440 RepID=A0A6L6PVL8_9BURK|nr:type VI secretion system protein TssA [Pseudoduganella ginsengisoli]MTW01485.1 type VI secretion system protein TssA [Pseudoduganella ginsengisoli]